MYIHPLKTLYQFNTSSVNIVIVSRYNSCFHLSRITYFGSIKIIFSSMRVYAPVIIITVNNYLCYYAYITA